MKKRVCMIAAAVLLFLFSMGLTLYPLISNYVNEKYASEIQTAYEQVLEETGDEELQEIRQKAVYYNESIAPGLHSAFSQDQLIAAACECNAVPNFRCPFRGEACNDPSRACANHHFSGGYDYLKTENVLLPPSKENLPE